MGPGDLRLTAAFALWWLSLLVQRGVALQNVEGTCWLANKSLALGWIWGVFHFSFSSEFYKNTVMLITLAPLTYF